MTFKRYHIEAISTTGGLSGVCFDCRNGYWTTPDNFDASFPTAEAATAYAEEWCFDIYRDVVITEHGFKLEYE